MTRLRFWVLGDWLADTKIELGLYIITNKDQTKTKIEILKKQAPKATYLRRLRGINWCR